MRKILAAFYLFLAVALVSVQTVQAASLDAGAVFGNIGGTTTIDRGGVIHSQARTIFSLGGGMVSFQGKKVSLLAADPPSFAAGCNGISWHFGGFAFISLDEIRQLVEAVAQASLGLAVDLAMQVLCPQCYAVMSKLRDISNMMRNAAADACQIAKKLEAELKDSLGVPSISRTSNCAQTTTDKAQTASFLDGLAGQACKLLGDAEKVLQGVGQDVSDWLNYGKTKDGRTPSRDQLSMSGNVTYKGLTALGYDDGVIKNLLLSVLGMHIVPPLAAPDCRDAFKNLRGSAPSFLNGASDQEKAAISALIGQSSPGTIKSADGSSQPTTGDANTKTANVPPNGSDKGVPNCFAPPVLSGFEDLGKTLMCGLNPNAERQRFANSYYFGKISDLDNSSLGAMCQNVATVDKADPLVYSCVKDDEATDCTNPNMMRLSTMLSSKPVSGYTGLAWMVGSALYDGVKAVRDNVPLTNFPTTMRILTGSDWPLYRLLNLAAVYPGIAQDLIGAYASAIAAQYAMDTLDTVARVGAQPAVSTKSVPGITPQSVSVLRETIQNMVRMGDGAKTQALERLAEKRKLVEIVVQVNKAVQAEVIGQGLSGNTHLAVSIKRRLAEDAAKKQAAQQAAQQQSAQKTP